MAFLIRADVRRGTASGTELSGDNELQSSTWQNNDLTLFPGESQTLTVTYNSADLQGATPVISLSGWNLPKIDVAAPLARRRDRRTENSVRHSCPPDPSRLVPRPR